MTPSVLMPSSWLNVGSAGLSMVVKVGLLPANADALSMTAAITMGANFIRNILFSSGGAGSRAHRAPDTWSPCWVPCLRLKSSGYGRFSLTDESVVCRQIPSRIRKNFFHGRDFGVVAQSDLSF